MCTLRYFLIDKNEQVLDSAGAFVTAVPNWDVGECFFLANLEKYRILEKRTDIAEELVDAGFNGIFVVEPA